MAPRSLSSPPPGRWASNPNRKIPFPVSRSRLSHGPRRSLRMRSAGGGSSRPRPSFPPSPPPPQPQTCTFFLRPQHLFLPSYQNPQTSSRPQNNTASQWSVHGSENRTLTRKRSCRRFPATKVRRKKSKSAPDPVFALDMMPLSCDCFQIAPYNPCRGLCFDSVAAPCFFAVP